MSVNEVVSWVLLLTFGAAAAAWYAVASINISGLLTADFTAAEVVRERCPSHLILPRWVAGNEQADNCEEMTARLTMLLVAWLLGVGGVVRLSARRLRVSAPSDTRS